MKKSYLVIGFLILIGVFSGNAQQDPQYTQYMYNTQVINPAYVGNKNTLNFGFLYRTQWVGLDGAPETGTLTIDSPIGSLDNMGLGLTIVRDQIGPSKITNITADYSYSIDTGKMSQLSFGIKAGIDVLNVDFSLLNIADSGDVFETTIDNKVAPQIGAGIYFNTDKFYLGLSVPNFLDTKHFSKSDLVDPDSGESLQSSTAKDRLHYFFIAGYVFDLGENLKFKPATLFKAVSGSPLQADLSLNFLLYEKLTLGTAYRWDAALSALAGFQVTDQIFIGFGYDFQTTDLQKDNGSSYEFILRFDVFNKPERVLTPRFF